MMGKASGTVILRHIVNSLAPSILALSNSDVGICPKKVVNKNIAATCPPAKDGNKYPKNVSFSPSVLLTNGYKIGIPIIDGISITEIKSINRKFLNGKLLYANI